MLFSGTPDLLANYLSVHGSRELEARSEEDRNQPWLGEQAATALESNLSNLESRLDAILAALEAKEDPQSSATATAAKAEPSSKATGAAGHEDEVQDGYGSHDATKDKDTA
ncbi:hypothetical protein ACHAPJ_006876 [Fusarium lateritium]